MNVIISHNNYKFNRNGADDQALFGEVFKPKVVEKSADLC